MPICRRLFDEVLLLAASRTFWTAGTSRPMRMAMMAITTSSSISVKPRRCLRRTNGRMRNPSAERDNEKEECGTPAQGCSPKENEHSGGQTYLDWGKP